jgi:hypothetical protein
VNDYRPFIGRQVLVFTEFMTFEGTLERIGKDSLTLTHTAAVAEDGGRKPIDGDTIVPRFSIQWVQVP